MTKQADMIQLPQVFTPEWCVEFQSKLDVVTRGGIAALKKLLPKPTACAIFERTERLLQHELPLLEVQPSTANTEVVVVGDTHGQYHDVCHMFEVAGYPSQERFYVFNGDFVDRGAWGMETLTLFCCWKLALPNHVFLLRGNHETATCTALYGFKGELEAKYGKSAYKGVYSACKKLFAALPLAALINKKTLVLHGGLFRKQPPRASGKTKRKLADDCMVGNLSDLKKASKGGLDPSGIAGSRLASDVIWSDPVLEKDTFQENEARGIGMIFSPEYTEQFLIENDLKLVLRSHEGPDAREDRPGFGNMLEGYTEDHVTASGRLITVFSAPDYPQFMAEEVQRYHNKGAVAVLSAPGYHTPVMKQYEAVLPRPKAQPYYELYVNDSDEEFELADPGTASAMTDVREEREKELEEVGSILDDIVNEVVRMEKVEEGRNGPKAEMEAVEEGKLADDVEKSTEIAPPVSTEMPPPYVSAAIEPITNANVAENLV